MRMEGHHSKVNLRKSSSLICLSVAFKFVELQNFRSKLFELIPLDRIVLSGPMLCSSFTK